MCPSGPDLVIVTVGHVLPVAMHLRFTCSDMMDLRFTCCDGCHMHVDQ
jgi:hypothetical protein